MGRDDGVGAARTLVLGGAPVATEQGGTSLVAAAETMEVLNASPATCAPASSASQFRDLILLTGILSVLVALTFVAEVVLLSRSTVPAFPDKTFLGTAIAFQVLMGVAFAMAACPSKSALRSRILDVCHWAFVLMVFSGPILLYSFDGVLLIFVLAMASLLLRITMRHQCIITSVAQTSSLPEISGERVTTFFWSLLAVCAARLTLMVIYGNGFPIGQLLGIHEAEDASASLSMLPLASLATPHGASDVPLLLRNTSLSALRPGFLG
eukprot:TRINITY_DN66436_c0_g1_i1.p1 TRINITY_DN66436_c0_g1~~TRINITY_DN66436_c0_g1_i1.p1  ORF type:complete len:267 (+),score=47.39 TRINITY_DN66436_c0_g1_i1:80-880(+)